jgi:hypothetical protein
MVNANVHDRERLAQYLLGGLSAAEAEALDELSITDDEVAARLEEVENDLVDAFVRGELKGKRLDQFNAHYLRSPRRRERVTFARSLVEVADRSMRPRDTGALAPGWHWGLAAAAILLVLAGGALLQQNGRLRSERDAAVGSLRELEARAQPALPESPVIVALHLAPQVRGLGQLPSIAIPANADFVRVELELEPNESSRFVVALRPLPAGAVVWTSALLEASGSGAERKIAVGLRASLLQPGTYSMEVTALAANGAREIAGTYPFRVTRE